MENGWYGFIGAGVIAQEWVSWEGDEGDVEGALRVPCRDSQQGRSERGS